MISRTFARHLRRLDYLPVPWLLAWGFGLAALAVALMAVLPIAGSMAFLLVLAAAVWLALTGEPIAIPEVLHHAQPVPAGQAAARRLAKSDPIEPLLGWVSIPSGTFKMGSADKQPRHAVTLSAFECMSIPVTRRLYRAIMNADPGWPSGDADARPVNNVSWHDAVAFCNRWSERDGLARCYRRDGTSVACDRSKNGYRLLTEAEWEYACRAGSDANWCFGDDVRELDAYAWYESNSGGEPRPVAQKRANAWGLYDMHGNVWEWVSDWYGSYPNTAKIDPDGPAGGVTRVLRGGAFRGQPQDLRSELRFGGVPGDRFRNFGFRCARTPAASTDD